MQNIEFGAHEILEAHEVLTDTIDGINQFELYRPHVSDPHLAQILDRQIRFMHQEYQNLSTYMNQHRGVSPAIYQSRLGKQSVQYGLRSPSDVVPHHGAGRLDDRDISSGMMGCSKASAALRMNAALECADPTLRSLLVQGSVSCSEQAYETFTYMNQKGMYQVPTMLEKTQATLMHTYHPPVSGIGAPQPGMTYGGMQTGMSQTGMFQQGMPQSGTVQGTTFNLPS